SPIKLPSNCKPVSSRVPAISRRTRPYVFFKFDVIVPAPRFAQRPITQWPTKPSCALFAYPRKTQLDSSPREVVRGPIADPRTGPHTPGGTTPDTSIAAACGWGPSHTAPGPTPQPTVTPPLVRRKTPSGSAGASPRGANVDEPITAGPGTGRRAATRGTPASANPARWGRAKIAAVSAPTNVSHRSRIRCAPARSSHSGRAPANGAHAGTGSGSSRS